MSAWWRRNRLWLLLLVPLALLAVAASSFRMTQLVLPQQWSRPITANGPSGTLTQEILSFANAHPTRTVTVTVRDATEVPSVDGLSAAPGGVMWLLTLDLAAEPDQLLAQGCEVTVLDAAGATYSTRAAKLNEYGDLDAALSSRCVPDEAPGPKQVPFGDELEPSPVERPSTWTVEESVVLPTGVTPALVRIGWEKPVYLELRVP